MGWYEKRTSATRNVLAVARSFRRARGLRGGNGKNSHRHRYHTRGSTRSYLVGKGMCQFRYDF